MMTRRCFELCLCDRRYCNDNHLLFIIGPSQLFHSLEPIHNGHIQVHEYEIIVLLLVVS